MAVMIKPSEKLFLFIKSIPKTEKNIPLALQSLQESETVQLISNEDLRWIKNYIHMERKPNVYLHELIEGSTIELPSLPPPPPRSKELEERIQRLKKEQEQHRYDQMVSNVSTKKGFSDESFSAEMKQINSHLIEVLGFLVTIAAGFAFGFSGVNYMIGPLDLGFRFILGVGIALIVAIAEIYFLARILGDYELFHFQKSKKKMS